MKPNIHGRPSLGPSLDFLIQDFSQPNLAKMRRQQEVGNGVLDMVNVVTVTASHLSLDDLCFHK